MSTFPDLRCIYCQKRGAVSYASGKYTCIECRSQWLGDPPLEGATMTSTVEVPCRHCGMLTELEVRPVVQKAAASITARGEARAEDLAGLLDCPDRCRECNAELNAALVDPNEEFGERKEHS